VYQTRPHRWALAALLPLLLVGSVHSSPPEEPVTALLPPPAEWATEYDRVWRQCGQFAVLVPRYQFIDLRFYTVEASPFHVQTRYAGRVEAEGMWEEDRIYLALPITRYALRHELLHAQIGRPGHGFLFSRCLPITEALDS
jgi:hypothetical protein